MSGAELGLLTQLEEIGSEELFRKGGLFRGRLGCLHSGSPGEDLVLVAGDLEPEAVLLEADDRDVR